MVWMILHLAFRTNAHLVTPTEKLKPIAYDFYLVFFKDFIQQVQKVNVLPILACCGSHKEGHCGSSQSHSACTSSSGYVVGGKPEDLPHRFHSMHHWNCGLALRMLVSSWLEERTLRLSHFPSLKMKKISGIFRLVSRFSEKSNIYLDT